MSRRRALILGLLLLAGCGPLELAGDAAVGVAQVAAGTADLVL